jgi:hypothetical protein
VTAPAGDFDEEAFARQQIEQICERALLKAGVAGVFPTPLEELAHLAGINEVLDISELPSTITKAQPRWLSKLLGALDFRSRTVFVDREQATSRARWTEAHETVHGLLPWHEASAFLDDDQRLFRHSEEAREVEANIGAGHLIFQGHRYLEIALSYRPSIAAPIEVAIQIGASRHASIRYYTEHHPEPAALLVGGRYPRADGHVPIFCAVESPSFVQRFGAARVLLPLRGIPVTPGIEPTVLSTAANEARWSHTSVAVDVTVSDINGERQLFVAELYSNSYCLFILFLPKKRVRLGKRLRLVSTPTASN